MKIHEATENIERQKPSEEITKELYQKIERKYHSYDTLTEVIQNRYKGFKGSSFSVRTSKELDTSLRVYSETHNIPIAESIKNILEDYFKDKFVARTFFRLEKSFTVAVPMIPYEIEKYIEDEIDCRIDLSSDIDDRLATQRQIISNEETDYYLAVTFNVGNNYLDIYDDKLESYCFGTIRDHHLGLFDVYLEHIDESIFIQVLYNGRNPISARLISKESALKLANNVDNEMLIKYIKGLNQANSIIEFKQSLANRETYIKTLEARIETLENELAIFNEDNDKKSEDILQEHPDIKENSTTTDDENLTDDKLKQVDHSSQFSSLPDDLQKTIIDSMIPMMKLQSQTQGLIKTIMQSNANLSYALKKAGFMNVQTLENKSDSDDSED